MPPNTRNERTMRLYPAAKGDVMCASCLGRASRHIYAVRGVQVRFSTPHGISGQDASPVIDSSETLYFCKEEHRTHYFKG
jgi:hypothetical protein